MGDVVPFSGVGLLSEDLAGVSMPDSRPAFVRPSQAELEGGRVRREYFGEGASEDGLSPSEPVVPVAECFHSVPPRQVGLRYTRLGEPKIVESQIGRKVRLHMTTEQRPGFGHVRPLREPGSHQTSFSGTG